MNTQWEREREREITLLRLGKTIIFQSHLFESSATCHMTSGMR